MTPKDFVQKKINDSSIALATRQQEQICYFTQSSIQDEVNIEYIRQWAQRKYLTNDYFLNWLKAVFKEENFLSFYKYFRKPLPSARLVNDKIKTGLKRVFHAEDSYFNYIVRGEHIEEPLELDKNHFNNKLFNAILFNYNDILIHDLKGVNEPYRDFVSIKNVISIESHDSKIHKIAYKAKVNIDGNEVYGFIYMDKDSYIFLDKDYNELMNIPHDLGECPADYITSEAFSDDDIVRKSIFSYVKEQFEEYVFLKTMQRMTEPNGAIPIVTMLNVPEKNRQGRSKDGVDGEPMSSHSISSQQSEFNGDVIGQPNSSPYQAGSVLRVPLIRKTDDSVDMELAKNLLTFNYIPVDILSYINERVKQIEKDIIVDVLGDYSEENEDAKNEFQVAKSYDNKQDKLRGLSIEISRVSNISDRKILALKHGRDSVHVDCFYGSDFFLETQEDLYNQFPLCPNTIERRNNLVRLTKNRNKFNPDKALRESLMYKLMPYPSDKDFDKALDRGLVDDITFLYQNRFTTWIDRFDERYGELGFFWNLLEGEDSSKINTINNLITDIIKEYYEQTKNSGTLTGVQTV